MHTYYNSALKPDISAHELGTPRVCAKIVIKFVCIFTLSPTHTHILEPCISAYTNCDELCVCVCVCVRERERERERERRWGMCYPLFVCVLSFLFFIALSLSLSLFLSHSRTHHNLMSSHIGDESVCIHKSAQGMAGVAVRGGGLGSSTIFKKFNEPYAPL